MTVDRLVRGARESALWSGAVLGLLAVAAGIAVVALNASFLVFRSGSMSPAIDTGALALATPVRAQDIRPGDVVSVHTADGSQITHRVVSSTVRGDEASLVLQGDANSTPDAEVYVVQTVERVDWSLPYAGYAVAFAMTPAGLVGVAAVCIALIVSPGAAPASRGARAGKHRRRRVRGRPLVAATAAAAAALAAGSVTGTQAAFTDVATATSGAFAADTVEAPTGVTCVNSGSSDYISWTAPSGYTPTAYRVFVNGAATAAAEVAPPVTQWRPATTLFPQTYANVRIVAVRGPWVSTPSSTQDSISTLFLFQGTAC